MIILNLRLVALKTRKEERRMLRFSDGVNINTQGEYRILHLKDGYYVVGHGMCIPVDSYEEGKKEIESLKENNPYR